MADTKLPPPPAKGPPKGPLPSNKATIKTEPPKLGKLEPIFHPPRVILHAVEGWGKTSMGSYTKTPAILMAKGETGYETLLGAGLVPSVPAARINTWLELLAIMDTLNGYETVVLDAIGGFEHLCHEYVCDVEYKGDWGEKGFKGYQRGADVAVTEWLKLLAKLDKLRDVGITTLLLSHTKIGPYGNPLGADYDRLGSDVHKKTWGVTHRWADAVLFGEFFTDVETNRSSKPDALRKGKGIGGGQRIIHTEWNAAYDAKNRYNMDPVIDIPDDPKLIWSTIREAIYNGKDK